MAFMIEVWSLDTLVAQSSPSDSAFVAIVDNITKADAIILHVSYIKGSEDGVTIRPTALDKYAIGEFPIQRLVGTAIQTVTFSLSGDGQYTLPIPLSKSWEKLKLSFTFTGDTSSLGSLYIVAIPDYELV